ncbi:hypothetical protein V6N13_001298 [Hibiscus sabdariffa]
MVGDIGDMENGNRSVDQGTQVLDVEVGRSSPRGICNKTMLKMWLSHTIDLQARLAVARDWDFNSIVCAEERDSGAIRGNGVSSLFQEFIFANGLLKAKYRGDDFTWKCGLVRKRLDRCLYNEEFLVQLDVELRAGLDEVLRQDERFWLLKSGVQWVKFGDRVMRKAFTVPVTDDENLVRQPEQLWVEVLKSKYHWHEHIPTIILRTGCSHLWKDVSSVWECVREGVCSVLEAELWGIAEGLRLPWDAGIRVVLLEVDNGDVARIVQDNAYVSGLHGLVPTISELVGRDWVVRVCQIRRTTNMVTDGMVKLARSSFVSSLLDVGLLLGFFRCLMMRLFT